MMARNKESIGFATLIFGFFAFIFGVIAENKKPENVVPVQIGSAFKCLYSHDPSIALGSLSIIFLVLSSGFGVTSIFYPYEGKSVPTYALWTSTKLIAFSIISMLVSILAGSFMLWATITESFHRHRNIHHDLAIGCPTAKTGLFGGAAFLALDACLFWLICHMLTLNAREDYEVDGEDLKGQYGKVSDIDYPPAPTSADYIPSAPTKGSSKV